MVTQQSTQSTQTATLAGGCFWCLEAVFEQLKGVVKVVSGYAGGKVENPSYRDVCTGATGHAEVVQVTYDPAQISYRDLLGVFFSIHDPTSLNRQGADVGTQYRSAIFYHDEAQKATAEAMIARSHGREALAQPHRDRNYCLYEILSGGELPPGVLPQQYLPTVLPGGDCAEGGQVPQAIPGAPESLT